jgi:hypothetical protein
MKDCYCEDSDDAKNLTCHHVTGECKLPGNAVNENQENNTHHPKPVFPTSHPGDNEDSYMHTYSTVQPTERSVSGLEDISAPNTEKHIISTDKKFTALTTNTFISTTTAYPITTEMAVKQQTSNEETWSSVTNIVPLHDGQTSGHDSETERTQIHDTNFSRQGEESVTTKINMQTGNSEPQNIHMPPHGRPIIVISDSLLSERIDEKKNEESKNGVLYLVSSVSVAGGVALALIVMATVTLFVSHHRNKAKVTVTENEMASLRKQQLEQPQPTPAPQMYSYTEEITACPGKLQLPRYKITSSNFFLHVHFLLPLQNLN